MKRLLCLIFAAILLAGYSWDDETVSSKGTDAFPTYARDDEYETQKSFAPVDPVMREELPAPAKPTPRVPTGERARALSAAAKFVDSPAYQFMTQGDPEARRTKLRSLGRIATALNTTQ